MSAIKEMEKRIKDKMKAKVSLQDYEVGETPPSMIRLRKEKKERVKKVKVTVNLTSELDQRFHKMYIKEKASNRSISKSGLVEAALDKLCKLHGI